MPHTVTQTELEQNNLLYRLCADTIPGFVDKKMKEVETPINQGSDIAQIATEHHLDYLTDIWDMYVALLEVQNEQVFGEEADTLEDLSIGCMITNFHAYLGGFIQGMDEQEEE